MSEFSDVAIVREANVYFEGKVTSRTIRFSGGESKTLGIMLPGEYSFNTDVAEHMEVLAGDLDIQLPGEASWRTIAGGESFEVPASASFSLRVRAVTDYCCSYLA